LPNLETVLKSISFILSSFYPIFTHHYTSIANYWFLDAILKFWSVLQENVNTFSKSTILYKILKLWQYRRPLLFARVPSEEYSANTKTENNRASQFWAFWTLFDFKKTNSLDNRGEFPWITSFVHNSLTVDSQNRE